MCCSIASRCQLYRCYSLVPVQDTTGSVPVEREQETIQGSSELPFCKHVAKLCKTVNFHA